MSFIKPFMIFLALFLTALFFGCAKEETHSENIRSLAAIRTACSTKSLRLIQNVRDQVQKDFDDGIISPKFNEELQGVFRLAESGDWEDAVQKVNRLQNKYKPNPETADVHRHDHGEE